MKITLTPMGGVGAFRRPPRVLDSSQLPEPLSNRLRELVTASRAVPRPGDPPGRLRDGMSYHVQVEDGPQKFEMTQSDGSMSAEFEALLSFLKDNTGPRT